MDYSKDHISFHDSSLIDASYAENSVRLSFEDVTFDDEQHSAIATISGIKTFTRDNIPICDFKMETADGEVLDFDIVDDLITLVLTWHQYTHRSHETHVYQMWGKSIRLDIDRA